MRPCVRLVLLISIAAVLPAGAQMRPSPNRWYQGPDGHIYRTEDAGTPLYLQRSIEYNSNQAQEIRRMQEASQWPYSPRPYPPPYSGYDPAYHYPRSVRRPTVRPGENQNYPPQVAPAASVFDDPQYRFR